MEERLPFPLWKREQKFPKCACDWHRLNLFYHFCFQAAALENLQDTELLHFHISLSTYFVLNTTMYNHYLFIACMQLDNWHKSISKGLESIFKTRPSSIHQKGIKTLTIKF